MASATKVHRILKNDQSIQNLDMINSLNKEIQKELIWSNSTKAKKGPT